MDLYERFKIPSPKPFGTDLDIYVAEAHNELRLIVQHHLGKLGFRNVRTARDGGVALAENKLKSSNILLVGDDLPNVKGLDFLKELREDPALTRECFLLLLKPVGKAEILLAIESGVDDLMVKPVAPADILPKLRAGYAAYVNPKNPERVYEYAKNAIREGNLGRAKEVYEALAESTSKAARPLVGLARVAVGEGEKETALNFLNQSIDRNPAYVHAYALRAELRVELGQKEEAVSDFVKAVELSPLNIARYEKSVEFLLKNEMLKPCITILEQGVAAGMQHPFVIERLGFCYFSEKEYPKALKFLRQATRLEPENINYMNSLAICFRDSKMFDEALDCYNQILKRDNDNYIVLFNKALVLLATEKKEEAAKILRRCLKLRPDFTKASEKLSEIGVAEQSDE
jgi:tetratricopeptide (TPR) repeat protein